MGANTYNSMSSTFVWPPFNAVDSCTHIRLKGAFLCKTHRQSPRTIRWFSYARKAILDCSNIAFLTALILLQKPYAEAGQPGMYLLPRGSCTVIIHGNSSAVRINADRGYSWDFVQRPLDFLDIMPSSRIFRFKIDTAIWHVFTSVILIAFSISRQGGEYTAACSDTKSVLISRARYDMIKKWLLKSEATEF